MFDHKFNWLKSYKNRKKFLKIFKKYKIGFIIFCDYERHKYTFDFIKELPSPVFSIVDNLTDHNLFDYFLFGDRENILNHHIILLLAAKNYTLAINFKNYKFFNYYLNNNIIFINYFLKN